MADVQYEDRVNLDVFEDGLLASDRDLEQLITDLQDDNGGDN